MEWFYANLISHEYDFKHCLEYVNNPLNALLEITTSNLLFYLYRVYKEVNSSGNKCQVVDF